MTEPDLRPPPAGDNEPDWDNLDASYEAPGARDSVGPSVPEASRNHQVLGGA